MEKQQPKKTFRAGSIRASIWDNDITLKNGETANMPRVCVERRYKNKEGKWTGSNSFNTNELGKLQAVIRAAFDYLVLFEHGDQSVTDTALVASTRNGGYSDVNAST